MSHPVGDFYGRMNAAMTSGVRRRIRADGSVTETVVRDGVVVSERHGHMAGPDHNGILNGDVVWDAE